MFVLQSQLIANRFNSANPVLKECDARVEKTIDGEVLVLNASTIETSEIEEKEVSYAGHALQVANLQSSIEEKKHEIVLESALNFAEEIEASVISTYEHKITDLEISITALSEGAKSVDSSALDALRAENDSLIARLKVSEEKLSAQRKKNYEFEQLLVRAADPYRGKKTPRQFLEHMANHGVRVKEKDEILFEPQVEFLMYGKTPPESPKPVSALSKQAPILESKHPEASTDPRLDRFRSPPTTTLSVAPQEAPNPLVDSIPEYAPRSQRPASISDLAALPLPLSVTSGTLMARDIQPKLRTLNASRHEFNAWVMSSNYKASIDGNQTWLDFCVALAQGYKSQLEWWPDSAYSALNDGVNLSKKIVDFLTAGTALIRFIESRRARGISRDTPFDLETEVPQYAAMNAQVPRRAPNPSPPFPGASTAFPRASRAPNIPNHPSQT